jgi:hypothetical protein
MTEHRLDLVELNVFAEVDGVGVPELVRADVLLDAGALRDSLHHSADLAAVHRRSGSGRGCLSHED